MKTRLIFALAVLLLLGSIASAQNGGYQAPPTGGGSPTGAITGLTSSTNNQSGVLFTGSQYNSNFLFSLNSCNPGTNGLESSPFTTDAFAGCVTVPSSGVSNGFSNGLAGYALNTNACTTCSGYGGPAGAVGVYANAQATVNHANVWGFDSTVYTPTSTTGNTIDGFEDDIYYNNSSNTGHGIFISARGSGAATGDNFDAIRIENDGNTFTSGVSCRTFSITFNAGSSFLQPCVNIYPSQSGASQVSQQVVFHTTTSGNVDQPLALAVGAQPDGSDAIYATPGTAGTYQYFFAMPGLELNQGTQTISGCSLTNAVGGSSGGSFKTGATSCTVTITPGFAASHGFFCQANDLTTTTDALHQSGTLSTTTCTLTGTVASSDLITWVAIAF